MKTTILPWLVCICLLAITTAQAQRGTRIGYVDMEYILESVPDYQEAKTMLDGRVQGWKRDIERMNQEIDQMKLNLSNERILLTPELIEEREEEIKIKEEEMLEYQQNRFGPGGDLDIQRRQLVQPIQDQVFNIVQDIAEKRKYDFIHDRSTDPSMLFAAKKNDVSEQVIRQINRAAKREEVKSKKDKEEVEARDALTVEEDAAITEREEAVQAKKDEREALLEERRRVRDSIKAARQAEYDARRQQLLEDRQRRKDSIEQARQNRNNPPDGDGDGDGEGDDGNNDN